MPTYKVPSLFVSSSRRFRSGEGSQPSEQENHLLRTHADPSPSTINVVLFGETGAGKSSVVNLIAQEDVAEVSRCAEGCTIQSTRYNVTLDGLNFAIFDTVGLEDPMFGVNSYLKAVEKLYELITTLSAAGGVHLLLYCMMGRRITENAKRIYRLMVECICNTKVPIALVFTGLERYEEMEGWWRINKNYVELYGLKSHDHACITTVKGDDPGEYPKYRESQTKIRELLKDCALKTNAYEPETHSWLARIASEMKSLIRNPKRRDVMKVLTQRCKLDPGTAKTIVEMMETGGAVNGEPSQGSNDVNIDFQRRRIERLERLADMAMDSRNHDEAIAYYSNALSLNPASTGIIVKCCRARTGFLEDELVNAIKDIELDPSCYKGYKRKRAALHGLGRYREAFDAFEMMLSRMENSLDPKIQRMRGCYLDTTPLIRQVVEQTIYDIPRVLIDTTTGRLFDKAMQAAAFEEAPIFNELRSFMTTRDLLDRARIQREAEKFYEYVMFSHRWQPPEPSFQTVENTVIYGLPASPTVDKLINFCKLVQSRRFRWAWIDTCCVNQSDSGVLQESIVSMFRWYGRAALTIVHLLGVLSESQEPGSLWKSIWNTRGWTFQEYVASRVVQFYTEDWKPYLGLDILNHKESPIILAEMEQATKCTARALAALQPGVTEVREKLYLASKRQTTRKEDIAYCLFGIFDVALPVVYGEGARAVGRLLEHVLMRSDNVTLLSWTRAGNSSSSTDSYLPADLTVYDQIEPPHVPQPIESADMDKMTLALQSSLPDPLLAIQLYERVYDLPSLSIVTGRLRLPGFVFSLTSLTANTAEPGSDSIIHAYHATTPILGDVHIETDDDLAGMHGLVLIHPWISPLLDKDFSGGAPQFDIAMRALRLVVRLRQPFGALLLSSRELVHYRRVATDSFIKVQVREETTLEELMDSIRTVDIQ